MTTTEIREHARRLSRTSSSGIADSYVNDLINDALTAFSEDVYGFPYEAYMTLDPRFDLETDMAIRLTVTGGSNPLSATDVAICAADALDQTGAQTATALETAIVAAGASDVTVLWNSNDLYFSLTDTGATSITVASPSGNQYIDANAMLFGAASNIQDSTWSGSFPEDCTLEVSMPSDFMKIEYVEWNKNRLLPHPGWGAVSPESQGTPIYYYLRGKKLRVWPTPTSQELFHIRYKRYAFRVSSFEHDLLSSPIPLEYHRSLCYWVAAEMCAENWEHTEHDRLQYEYRKYRNKYVVNYNNQVTAVEEPDATAIINYKVSV